jgi:hypothetical protein
VRGTVYSAAGRPLAGGFVYFQSDRHPTLTTAGAIQQDGTYELNTSQGKKQVAGAAEGAYRVTVAPPTTGGHAAAPAVMLPVLLTVEPKENQLDIHLVEATGPRP